MQETFEEIPNGLMVKSSNIKSESFKEDLYKNYEKYNYYLMLFVNKSWEKNIKIFDNLLLLKIADYTLSFEGMQIARGNRKLINYAKFVFAYFLYELNDTTFVDPCHRTEMEKIFFNYSFCGVNREVNNKTKALSIFNQILENGYSNDVLFTKMLRLIEREDTILAKEIKTKISSKIKINSKIKYDIN